MLVSTDEICAAIQDIFEDTRSISEPAGALAVAGIKQHLARSDWRDQRLVAINSGANLNFDRLRHVAERADIGAEREALLAVEIPEQPGSFLQFCEAVGQRSITEFNYRGQGSDRARIFVGFGLSGGHDERLAVIAQLRAAGYAVTDMSGNEIAKLHIRYMIGGHAPPGSEHSHDELLYRFEFPERPGALLRFLQAIGTTLEHQSVSLPQSRLRLRPRAGRHRGAEGRARGISAASERAALSLHRREREPRLSHVPRRLMASEHPGSRVQGRSRGA